MTKIGICDDNITLLQKYRSMIEVICENETFNDVEIYTFHNGEDVVEALTKNREALDILFLDILMEKMDGIEAARQIRLLKSKVMIIFLTSSEEYMFDSMDIKAYAYLMKEQVTKTSLKKILIDVYSAVIKKKDEIIVFKKEDGTYNLSYSDICFIKIYKGFCYLHHWDGIIFESANCEPIANLDETFFKVHEQYIINLDYIKKIGEDNITLSDESENVIPLDNTRFKELKLRFAQYMMDKL